MDFFAERAYIESGCLMMLACIVLIVNYKKHGLNSYLREHPLRIYYLITYARHMSLKFIMLNTYSTSNH
jgi:hypothetical protein